MKTVFLRSKTSRAISCTVVLVFFLGTVQFVQALAEHGSEAYLLAWQRTGFIMSDLEGVVVPCSGIPVREGETRLEWVSYRIPSSTQDTVSAADLVFVDGIAHVCTELNVDQGIIVDLGRPATGRWECPDRIETARKYRGGPGRNALLMDTLTSCVMAQPRQGKHCIMNVADTEASIDLDAPAGIHTGGVIRESDSAVPSSYWLLSAVVDTPKVEVLNAEGEQTDVLRIGKWEGCYAGTHVLNTLNGPYFVAEDVDRFRVRVTDSSKNTSDDLRDMVEVLISTLLPSEIDGTLGEVDDDKTRIQLVETDKATGVFESKWQLLVTADFPLAPLRESETDHIFHFTDDDFPAFDGFVSYEGGATKPADGTLNDPTHRAVVGGDVVVDYSAGALRQTLSVCHPDSTKYLNLRVFVFREPFIDENRDGKYSFQNINRNVDAEGQPIHDPGEPGERYVDLSSYEPQLDSQDSRLVRMRPVRGEERRQIVGNQVIGLDGYGTVVTEDEIQEHIRGANLSWAQACITIRQVETTQVIDAPQFGFRNRSLTIDGFFDIRENMDITPLLANYPALEDSTVLDVFFAGPIRDGASMVIGGFTLPPEDPLRRVFVSPHVDSTRTLAHEIGHAISLFRDPKLVYRTPSYLLFPTNRAMGKESTVNHFRRITQATEDAARNNSPHLVRFKP